MYLVQTLVILTAVIFCFSLGYSLQFKEEGYKKNAERCTELSKNPYFDIEQVVGKPWRIYYTWNGRMDDKCVDMIFKNATASVINRIYNDMYDYMEHQPNWDAATLHVSLGTAQHEVLLFASQGTAGHFDAIPNVVREGNISPMRRSVPILKFFLKLLSDGTYLLMSDCKMGVTTLSSRERPPYRAEVASVANSLQLGRGDPACVSEKKKDEQMFVK